MPRITVTQVTTAEELDVAMAVWAAADRTRPRPSGPERTARVRGKVAEGERVLLAHYGDLPAGMALAETFDDGVRRRPDTGHIATVAVDPARWGSRIGTTLVRGLQDRWPRLSVWIHPGHRRARRLFAATGFTETGQVTELQDGGQLAQLLWERNPDE
ncbi:GNAT family N-acetyltransferase [Nocardioides insulae]|uniref:GNAT family N-acetyltransferase n=1 Tax=Nocardioides insulae TaxID=394734 RepID=UPI0003FAD033|nr:GNAT family N-acetyltransferase [Nocardioides insulae]